MLWIVTAVLVQGLVSPAQSSAAGAVSRSKTENSLIAEALAHFGYAEDQEPEGKRIESIEVYVAKVFDYRDPMPGFVNVFHASTRDWVVRQEVLQQEGELWQRGRILETERNLRALRQLSIANVVAATGSDPQSVRAVVVVKDVWSLRVNSNWAVGAAGLDYLVLNPTEENLAGTRSTVGALFSLERDRYLLGGTFHSPRLGGTRYEVAVSAGVIENRFGGGYEGNYGGFLFQLPQFSRHSRFAYGVDIDWRFSIARRYDGSRPLQVSVETERGVEVLPWMYRTQSLTGDYFAVRSWGVRDKMDISFGISVSHRRSSTINDADYSPQAVLAFRRAALPVADTRISPYVQLAVYQAKFLRVLNLESLGLQEDFRLGHALTTSLFVGAKSFGSTRDLLGSRVRLSYTWALGDGLLRLGAQNRIVLANGGKNEGAVLLQGRFASPHFGPFRLHGDGFFSLRYRDYLNSGPYVLGGANRLRGYAQGGDVRGRAGKNLVAGNAELRTASVNLLSAEVGLAAFYDVGSAADDPAEFSLYHGAGGGLRFLFPQLERTVLRLDWGLPMSGDRSLLPGAFYFTFGQGFPLQSPFGPGSPFVEY